MSTVFNVRPAAREDCGDISALLSELIREEEGEARSVPRAAIEAALFAPRAVELQAIVAEVEGAVVGVALFYWGYDTLTVSEGYRLADIIVTAAFRRAGIGRALMASAAAQCLREGGQWMALTVLRTNDAARAFYRGLTMTHIPVDVFAMGPSALMKLSG